eukprot:3054587-Rhodomonas_salina.1
MMLAKLLSKQVNSNTTISAAGGLLKHGIFSPSPSRRASVTQGMSVGQLGTMCNEANYYCPCGGVTYTCPGNSGSKPTSVRAGQCFSPGQRFQECCSSISIMIPTRLVA